LGLQHHNELSREDENRYILECKKDISKFRHLYEEYHHRILNYIYHKILDKELAADLCSTVFLKAMTALEKYKVQETPFSAWLFKIAYTEMMMHFRKTKQDPIVILDEIVLDGLHDELFEFDKESLLVAIENSVKHLDKQDLELIELRYYENKSFKDIGIILSCSENTAKVRSHRLIMKLKRELIKIHRHEAY